MKRVRYSPLAPSRDLDMPSTVAHRSVTGDSLFLISGHSYEFTDDEWAWLERDHKALLSSFEVLA